MSITTSNCNWLINQVSREQDLINKRISRALDSGRLDLVSEMEEKYNELCDKMDELTFFRRNHDCLIEGDPGFGPV